MPALSKQFGPLNRWFCVTNHQPHQVGQGLLNDKSVLWCSITQKLIINRFVVDTSCLEDITNIQNEEIPLKVKKEKGRWLGAFRLRVANFRKLLKVWKLELCVIDTTCWLTDSCLILIKSPQDYRVFFDPWEHWGIPSTTPKYCQRLKGTSIYRLPFITK